MMKLKTSTWIRLLAVLICLFPLAARALLVPGRDYGTVQPVQLTDDPSRIEVIEFFSYACPHCNEFNPSLQKWAARLPADVRFKRVPVSFSPFYGQMARLYYTLEATGDLARLDAAVFSAIHEKGAKLVSQQTITAWAVDQGVDARKFSEAWNSFTVDSKTKRAHQAALSYRIEGVPTMAVDGRYLVSGHSHEEMLSITDELIAKRRAERAPQPGKPAAKK